MKSLSFILFIALQAGILAAQDTNAWHKDGKAAADTASMKSKNGFGAQLLLTDNEQFFEDWNKEGTPTLKELKKAVRDVPILPVVLIVDPGKDDNGEAKVIYDIIVRKPDGTVYAEAKDMVGWREKYDFPAHNIQLTEEHMGIRIEPKDPSGVYTVEAIVHDKIKKIDLPLKATFEIPKSDKPESKPADKAPAKEQPESQAPKGGAR